MENFIFCAVLYSLISFYMPFVCRSYAIRMCSYVIRMSLVCTRHLYHPYVTRTWFYHEPLVHGKTTDEWHTNDIRLHTSDIRMTYKHIQLTYGCHMNAYEWHTNEMRVYKNNQCVTKKVFQITSMSLKKLSKMILKGVLK